MHIIYIGRSRLQRNRANLLQTLHMMQAFTRLGFQATLYLPPWPRSLDVGKRLHDFGVDERLDIRASQLLHSRWKNRPFVWFYQNRLRRADAVYARSVPLSLLLCARAIPHILEIHDTAASAEAELREIARCHRDGLIRWLLPISEAAKSVLLGLGADSERMLTAPSGVDLRAFADIAPYRPRQGVPHAVYPGALSRDRGLGVFEALAERGLAEVTLLGEQHDKPADSPNLTLRPFAPHREIPAWYARADVVLLPYQPHLGHAASISPIKLFEAMAAGRPIVASDLPAIREIVEHEQTGLLVAPNDIEAWANALRRLREAPDLAARLAEAARNKASDYSWERRARRIAQACGWLA